MNPPIVIRNGKEHPIYALNRGDEIAFRDYDVMNQRYVFYVVTRLPASEEVEGYGG